MSEQEMNFFSGEDFEEPKIDEVKEPHIQINSEPHIQVEQVGSNQGYQQPQGQVYQQQAFDQQPQGQVYHQQQANGQGYAQAPQQNQPICNQQMNNGYAPQQGYQQMPQQGYQQPVYNQQGYAPAPQQGYAPAPQQGQPMYNQQGYAPAPQQGYQQMPQQGYAPQQGYQQMPQQGYAPQQGYQQPMYNQQGSGELVPSTELDATMANITEYKQRLRQSKEVQDLTSEVNIQDTNSIINFGQKSSEGLSKVSDELLNSMKAVKTEEATEMLSALTRLMDKFDVKEIENMNDGEKRSFFGKLLNKAQETVASIFQKYDTMGTEVQKVYTILKKYEQDIKASNYNLKKLYDANIAHYQQLEKYIVAGEMAVEQCAMYLQQVENDPSINKDEKDMLLQKLSIAKDMLEQRVYDLQIAENVAIQAAPMIQVTQMSNFNLMRKINSSFIVTLPIFKQCLAQAIILKRQEIQAKSIKQLDDKTNELLLRNASNTARQSVEIAKMASTSSVQIETLQKSFDTIMKGIEETKNITRENQAKRLENAQKLEQMKQNMQKEISGGL